MTFEPTIIDAASEKQAAFAADKAKVWVKLFDKTTAGYLGLSDAEMAEEGFTRADIETRVAEAKARFERPIAARLWIDLAPMADQIINVTLNDALGIASDPRDAFDIGYARQMGLV